MRGFGNDCLHVKRCDQARADSNQPLAIIAQATLQWNTVKTCDKFNELQV